MAASKNIITRILSEVRAERNRQIKLGWTADHDVTHDSYAWVAIICTHAGRAIKRGKGPKGWDFRAQIFRESMIKVAALAVAAVEWIDLKEGK